MEDNTTLWVKYDTRRRLIKFGKYGDTADTILNRLMDEAEAKKNGRVE